MLEKLTNPFLKLYLEYVEDTESPRLFHVWAALTGIGACLGRRAKITSKIGDFYPNEYVLLVGPPAMRKTVAVNLVEDLVRAATDVRFAPTDTGGQRQGLIKAMAGHTEGEDAELERLLNGNEFSADLTALGNIEISSQPCNKEAIFAVADELSSLIGTNAKELSTFLIKVYDGKRYSYELKTSSLTLEQPLMSLLAGTTPTAIADNMPSVANGAGLTSRIIFVYANRKYKSVPPSELMNSTLPDKLRDQLIGNFKYARYDSPDKVEISKPAFKLLDFIYETDEGLEDPRFVHYNQRRDNHLMRLAFVLAVGRKSAIIEEIDVQEAHLILTTTELEMADALGEYGLSPLGAAKQKLLEFLQNAKGPVHSSVIHAAMMKDMTTADLLNTLAEFINADKVMEVDMVDGNGYVYISKVSEQMKEIYNAI